MKIEIDFKNLTKEEKQEFNRLVAKGNGGSILFSEKEDLFFIKGHDHEKYVTQLNSTFCHIDNYIAAGLTCANQEIMNLKLWETNLYNLLWKYQLEHENESNVLVGNVTVDDHSWTIKWYSSDTALNEWRVEDCYCGIMGIMDVTFTDSQTAYRAIQDVVIPYCKEHGNPFNGEEINNG